MNQKGEIVCGPHGNAWCEICGDELRRRFAKDNPNSSAIPETEAERELREFVNGQQGYGQTQAETAAAKLFAIRAREEAIYNAKFFDEERAAKEQRHSNDPWRRKNRYADKFRR